MLTNNRLRHVLADELEAGELFIHSFDGVTRSLLLKLFTPPDGTPLYGVLESPSFTNPFTLYAGKISGRCLSIGMDWFLETILGPETSATSRYQHDATHRLFLDTDGCLAMRFQGDEGRSWLRSICYAVGDTKQRSMDHMAAPIARFRVWQHREDYQDIRARPILTYPADV